MCMLDLSKGDSMIIAGIFRAMNAVRVVRQGLFGVSSPLLLAICCPLVSPTEARARLCDTHPLPAVKYAPEPDGITVSVGAEQVHISVCRSSVMHFVANPEPSRAIRQSPPWMLDSKAAWPGS